MTDRLKIQGGILSTREWVGVVLFLKTSRLKLTALDIIQACLPRLETRHKVIALPAVTGVKIPSLGLGGRGNFQHFIRSWHPEVNAADIQLAEGWLPS